MAEIKYALISTVDQSLKSFLLPYVDLLKKEKYEVALLANMSEAFHDSYGERYKCIPLDIERGFHLGKTIKCTIWLYRHFRKEKYDIIEYATENASLCASIAGFFAGVPIRLYNHWGALFVGYDGFKRIVTKTIERLAALFSTDVRQVSEKNLDLCVRERIYPRRKVKVLGKGGTVGVDFYRFDLSKKKENRDAIHEQYKIPDEAVVFGFLGRINSDKGVNELIQAFRKLSEEDEKVWLCLVGGIDEAKQIDAENMNWAKACPRVVFTGQVSEVPKYLAAFDIMTHPTYREGFGMVLQEAAALKVPIITTDIIGPGEFIQHNKTGILVPAKDSESLYRAMKDLLSDERRRNDLAEQGYQYTKTYFERSVMVQRIIDDRESLLQERLH